MNQNTVRTVKGKGRAVFARQAYRKGQVVARCPALVISARDWARISQTALHAYPYEWTTTTAALALGEGSLYNHSATPNIECVANVREGTLDFLALRPIRKGEEISTDYTAGQADAQLWFTVR